MSEITTSMILFACALVMGYRGMARYRAGQRGRAAFLLYMALSMVIFGLGYWP